MTTQSFTISSVGCDPTRNPDVEDDLSVATPPVGHRNPDSDHEFISKTIRFYFAPADGTRIDSIAPSEVHLKWLRTISTTFGTDVKFINNNNKPVLNIDTNPTAVKGTSYNHQFKVHQKPMGFTPSGSPKTAVIIVHRILTRVPFSQLKRHSEAFQLLTEHNCYLREHMWDEHEWDVQQIGFVTGFNPKFYTPERVTTSFHARLCKAQPKAKVPKFQMVLKSHKISHQGRTSSTQAFTVEVPTKSVPQLISIIKDVTKETKEYVAFQMRRRNPEAFQGAIRYQNHTLANQHVIMINHLGVDAMYYLSDRIRSISGVYDVIPTRKVSENGKFYVLVGKQAEKGVRESLKKRFDNWFREVVPEDAKPQPGRFDGPPEVGNPRSDGFSSGDNSWMTTSTKSFMSFSVSNMGIRADSDEHDLDGVWEKRSTPSIDQSTVQSPPMRPLGKTFESYAAATVSDQVSGMTEPEQTRDVCHEELSTKIATLEAMIVELCKRVQLLTDNSAHYEDGSHQSGKRIDRKDTPRKHKRPQQYSASSSVEEDTNELAPMDDDRLTAWDDYSPQPKND